MLGRRAHAAEAAAAAAEKRAADESAFRVDVVQVQHRQRYSHFPTGQQGRIVLTYKVSAACCSRTCRGAPSRTVRFQKHCCNRTVRDGSCWTTSS